MTRDQEAPKRKNPDPTEAVSSTDLDRETPRRMIPSKNIHDSFQADASRSSRRAAWKNPFSRMTIITLTCISAAPLRIERFRTSWPPRLTTVKHTSSCATQDKAPIPHWSPGKPKSVSKRSFRSRRPHQPSTRNITQRRATHPRLNSIIPRHELQLILIVNLRDPLNLYRLQPSCSSSRAG